MKPAIATKALLATIRRAPRGFPWLLPDGRRARGE
jgi:hypothetical protein